MSFFKLKYFAYSRVAITREVEEWVQWQHIYFESFRIESFLSQSFWKQFFLKSRTLCWMNVGWMLNECYTWRWELLENSKKTLNKRESVEFYPSWRLYIHLRLMITTCNLMDCFAFRELFEGSLREISSTDQLIVISWPSIYFRNLADILLETYIVRSKTERTELKLLYFFNIYFIN